MYLRFGAPISTATPADVSDDTWAATIKQRTRESLEQILDDLREIRSSDPYRELNPLAWHRARQP